MITINDYDLPIMTAQKIITGKKPHVPNILEKTYARTVLGDESEAETTDMFSLEDIQEIAEYLMVYVKSHENGD